jgi:hypothetical protein
MGISKNDAAAGSRPYLGTRGFRWVGRLLAVAGIAAAVAGPAYAVNGATQAPGAVEVTAALRPDREAMEPFQREDVLAGDQAADGVLVLDDGEVVVSAAGSTVPEQLLARGDSALLGLTVGAAALLLLPVLTSIREGEPFRPGHARRFSVLAGVVAVYGVAGPLLPAAATSSVLHRTGLSQTRVLEPDGAIFGLLPFVVVVGLLVLAEAFRRGEQLADDVEGLV